MFLPLSVILSTGGVVSALVHAGIHPPGRPPWADTPPGQTPPPPQQTTTTEDGTHPTGCFLVYIIFLVNKWKTLLKLFEILTVTHAKMIHCLLCSRAFVSKRDYNDHMDAVHYNNRKYSCEACAKTFVRKSVV